MEKSHRQRYTEMKAAIVQAARAVILESGPEHFSLREIARRSGYSPAGLYEYFSGKQDIVQAVADESLAQLHTALSYGAKGLTPPERLVALGLRYVRFARDNPQHFMLIFARLPSRRASLQVAPQQNSPYQLVVQIVQEGVDVGAFVVRPGFGVEEMAYGVWVIAHGMAMLQQTHLQQFQADFEAHDRHVLEAFVRSLSHD